MSNSFAFKQFEIHQSRSAFKLGTDSVLLACWLPPVHPQTILDVGSGTGILSLVCAQRFTRAQVTSVEIDEGSYLDMANNFAQSLWSDRLIPVHSDILRWSAFNREKKMDLIITNPPYFQNSLLNPDSRRSAARHNQHLQLQELAEVVGTHLSPPGRFAVVLPLNEFNVLKEHLFPKNIFPTSTCTLSSYENTQPIRKLGVFEYHGTSCSEEHQYIYNADKTRSAWYAGITKEFYLK